MNLQVFISPHPDADRLIRRPIANWIIRELNCEFNQTNLFLLESCKTSSQQEDEELSDDMLCIQEEGQRRKHYLFSVER